MIFSSGSFLSSGELELHGLTAVTPCVFCCAPSTRSLSLACPAGRFARGSTSLTMLRTMLNLSKHSGWFDAPTSGEKAQRVEPLKNLRYATAKTVAKGIKINRIQVVKGAIRKAPNSPAEYRKI